MFPFFICVSLRICISFPFPFIPRSYIIFHLFPFISLPHPSILFIARYPFTRSRHSRFCFTTIRNRFFILRPYYVTPSLSFFLPYFIIVCIYAFWSISLPHDLSPFFLLFCFDHENKLEICYSQPMLPK